MPLSRALALVPLLAACTADESLPEPTGPHYQYVVSDLRIPATNADARTYGLDLDGDKIVDNQLGMIFATLNSMGLGVGDTAYESLLRGGLLMLADLQTSAFDRTESSAVTMYLGRDPMPVPCIDPARLETCGQHLRGTGQFTADADAASDRGIAPVESSQLVAGMLRLPVHMTLVSNEPIRLDLHAARIRLTDISASRAIGTIAGGIAKADIRGTVVTQAALQMDRIITSECGQPAGGSPCGCPQGRAYSLQGWFDANDDCRVDADELATNSLVVSLLAPDLRIDGEELLSFGVGIELVAATFSSP